MLTVVCCLIPLSAQPAPKGRPGTIAKLIRVDSDRHPPATIQPEGITKFISINLFVIVHLIEVHRMPVNTVRCASVDDATVIVLKDRAIGGRVADALFFELHSS